MACISSAIDYLHSKRAESPSCGKPSMHAFALIFLRWLGFFFAGARSGTSRLASVVQHPCTGIKVRVPLRVALRPSHSSRHETPKSGLCSIAPLYPCSNSTVCHAKEWHTVTTWRRSALTTCIQNFTGTARCTQDAANHASNGGRS